MYCKAGQVVFKRRKGIKTGAGIKKTDKTKRNHGPTTDLLAPLVRLTNNLVRGVFCMTIDFIKFFKKFIEVTNYGK